MKRVAASVAAVISLLLFSLVGVNCKVAIIGSGVLVTEQKDFTGFSKVDVGSAFDVNIVKNAEFSITITADDNVMEHVRVRKDGSALIIDTDLWSINRVTLRVAITMPDIDELNLSGATWGTIIGFNTSETFICEISGASRITYSNITFGDVTAHASGASTIDGSLVCGDIDIGLSGASSADLEGEAADVTLDASQASGADLGGFTVVNADVALSGASDATIRATGTIDANLSDASSLYYSGTLGDVTSSGASSINKVDLHLM